MKVLFSKNIYMVLALILISAKTFSQIDPHFSQYYAYPLYLNPALTGVIDGNYRVTGNVKQQWSSLNKSFVTGGVSFDMAPKKNLAFGGTILNQQAGELNFNYLTALISSSYRIHFGQRGDKIINFGLQAGFINRSFNLSNAQFGDSWNGGNQLGYSSEALANTSSFTPDINAGIMFFDGDPDKNVNVFAGASIAHLNRPSEKFSGVNRVIPMRLTAHGGMRVKVNESFDLVPNAILMYQGNSKEIALGSYGQFAINDATSIMIGANYRLDDAAIAYVGLQIKNTVIGLSYDVNTSSLRQATHGNGGLEISISLIGRNGIIGPNFFCPRL